MEIYREKLRIRYLRQHAEPRRGGGSSDVRLTQHRRCCGRGAGKLWAWGDSPGNFIVSHIRVRLRVHLPPASLRGRDAASRRSMKVGRVCSKAATAVGPMVDSTRLDTLSPGLEAGRSSAGTAEGPLPGVCLPCLHVEEGQRGSLGEAPFTRPWFPLPGLQPRMA